MGGGVPRVSRPLGCGLQGRESHGLSESGADTHRFGRADGWSSRHLGGHRVTRADKDETR